jgi:hypothetical protein
VRNVSLELRNDSVELRNVSLELRNVSLILRNHTGQGEAVRSGGGARHRAGEEQGEREPMHGEAAEAGVCMIQHTCVLFGHTVDVVCTRASAPWELEPHRAEV